jgi:hypothetical protein
MSSFTNLLSRLSFINEAASPIDTLIPGFQKHARGLAAAKGASASTREGKLAFLNILYDLDIIDDSVLRMFKNDPSVSRMVQYLEDNGISKVIKSRISDIQDYIKDKIEDKIGFTTGNRTDAAQQRMEMNRFNNELKAIEKVAQKKRQKNTATAINSVINTVEDSYEDLLKSIAFSYSEDYMIRIAIQDENDLKDLHEIVKYLKQFINDDDIEIARSTVQATFSPSTKLGKLINKLGIEEVENIIMKNLKYMDVGVVIYPPDANKKPDMIGDLGQEDEEYSENEEGAEPTPEELNELGVETPRYENGQVPKFSTVKESSVLNYMSEQRVYSTPKPIVESVSFKDKFKPKTAKQLAELRNYGM